MKNKIFVWICMLMLLVSPILALTDFTQNLVAYYDGSGSGTNLIDVSGSATQHNGTANKTIDFIDGVNGNGTGIHFDGGLSIVVTDHADLDPQHIAISVWFIPNGTATGFPTILAKDTINTQYSVHYESAISKWYLKAFAGGNKNAGHVNGTDNQRIHIAATSDGSNLRFWFNGDLKQTTPASGNLPSSASDLYLGTWDDLSNAFEGMVDELAIWSDDKPINASTISDLWNNGQGCFINDYCFNGTSPPTPDVDRSTLDIIFKNLTNSSKTVFAEDEHFIPYLNHSLSTGEQFNSDCNVSAEKGLIELTDSDEYFTLCGTGCDYETRSFKANFSGKSLTGNTGINDTVHFNLCHEQVPIGDVNVSISCDSGNYWKVIGESEIPICSSGFSSVFIENPTCSGDTTVNVSIYYDGINVRRKNVSFFSYDREYEVLKMKANEYSELLNFNSTFIEYYKHGTKTINASCYYNLSFSNVTSETITIENSPPEIIHSGILIEGTVFNMTNGTKVEYVGGVNYSFIVSIQDDDLINGNHTLYCNNATGSVLWTDTHAGEEDTHDVWSGNFTDFVCNPFIFTSWGEDSNGNVTKLSTSFNVTDTVNPQVSGFNDFVALENTTTNQTIIFTDENFFSYNISCNNSYSQIKTGLNVVTYSTELNLTTPLNSGDVFCSVRFCDGHTSSELKYDWYVYKPVYNKFVFQINNYYERTLEFVVENVSINYTFNKNKISFTAEVLDDVKYRDWLIKYPCEDCYYFEDDTYKAWIVDDTTKTWLDLNGVKEDVHVFYRNGTYEFRFNSNAKKIKFESIGELNCQDANLTIDVREVVVNPLTTWYGEITNYENCKMNTTVDLLILFFVYGMFIIFLILNFNMIKIPAMDIFIGLFLIIYAMTFFSCGILIGFAFTVIGIVVLLYGLYNTHNA